jgi:hypothetical protein
LRRDVLRRLLQGCGVSLSPDQSPTNNPAHDPNPNDPNPSDPAAGFLTGYLTGSLTGDAGDYSPTSSGLCTPTSSGLCSTPTSSAVTGLLLVSWNGVAADTAAADNNANNNAVEPLLTLNEPPRLLNEACELLNEHDATAYELRREASNEACELLNHTIDAAADDDDFYSSAAGSGDRYGLRFSHVFLYKLDYSSRGFV